MFDLFLVATPGLEAPLADEARDLGLAEVGIVPGGVTCRGGWSDIWRANLRLRGATRVLVRIGEFRALHLAQLDKRARKFPWADFLRPDIPVRVEATCRKSRIYHAGAAAQRVRRAIAETLGAPTPEPGTEIEGPSVSLKLRIEDDLCTFSIDSTGASLHKRDHKQFVGKAPMRETMAAMFLRECGFRGNMPVLDPMCGSGTFVIEAAEIAAGLAPGRSRSFAFEYLAGFDAAAWQALRVPTAITPPALPLFHGSDRDDGAIRGSIANAERAGVAALTQFQRLPVSDITPPPGTPGLVMINPPYGARIGQKGPLFGLHAALGQVLKERFGGWRVGLVTSDAALARATTLPFLPPGPYVAHGGLKVRLHRTDPLPS